MTLQSPPPRVSVLIPSYQHAAYLRGAVESVLQQTFSDLELIVIDDASKDDSWDVLTSMDDARLRLFRHETTQGAHRTLNEAIELARGDFIAILNSDDLYLEDRLEALVAEAIKTDRPDVFIFTDIAFMDGQGRSQEDHPRALGYMKLLEEARNRRVEDGFLQGNLAVTTSNFFFSRSLFVKVGPFHNLRYTHDWDWVMRASLEVPLDWLHRPLLRYRVHGTNTLSEDDLWRHIQENSLIQAKALIRFKAEGSPDRLRERLSALLCNESLHPTGLLMALLAVLDGFDDSQVSALLLGTEEAPGLINALQLETKIPEAVFYSIKRIGDVFDANKAQTALLEERFKIIESMTLEVKHRDEALEGQARTLDERFKIIESMTLEVKHRDEALEGQARTLEERFATIQDMSLEIAHRDEAMAAMGTLLEKRFEAMKSMGDEIHQRDQAIHSLQAELHSLQAEFEQIKKKPLAHLLRTIQRGHKG
ncbi:MAG: glycosyltransferase [Gammaproteobacteria bacterium]|nr:glycosyltransferase [Gammaproteobacteria bacterium]